MKKTTLILFIEAIYVSIACFNPKSENATATPPNTASVIVKLETVTDKVSLPTAFAVVNDGTKRLFVCEQEGRIRIIDKGQLLATPLLDITKVVVKESGYDERGLLGLAFHPDFKNNRKFYVYYSAKTTTSGQDCKSTIEEFEVSKTNPDVADAGSGRVVLAFDHPESNHNGGDIKFGADGFLYIAVGDGGGANDRHGKFGNGQILTTLLGKILRIDVNKATGYGIPADNPFVGKTNTKPEIYAYGLRNPWRISFDSKSQKLFAGDVGQNKWEEVDIITKGGNYGWRQREGTHAFQNGQKTADMIEPIVDYSHSEGISITGGYVYRGSLISSLSGNYIFGDYMGPTWYLSPSTNGTWTKMPLKISNKPSNWQIYSFGQDEAGEVYILANLPDDDNKGVVYKIVK